MSSTVLLLHVVVPSEAEWCVSQITRRQRTRTKLSGDTATVPQPAKSVLSIWRRTHSIRATYRHGTHRQAPQRRSFALGAFVKIPRQDDSTKLQAQIADDKQQRNADGTPLGAPVVNVDVGDREVGARRLGRPVHVKSRAKSILVERNGAVVGGDVDVLRKGTAGDEACTFLKADYVPWSVEVSCQGTRILALCKDQGSEPGEDLRRGDCSKNSGAGSRPV